MMKRLMTLTSGGLALVLLAGGATAVYGQSEAAAPFLLISPGARAGGMGEAHVATVDDATAAYWNPAALSRLERRHFSLMHSQWLPQFNLSDLYYEYAAYAQHREGLGTWAVSVTFLNLGEQERTDETGVTLGTFSSYDLAVGGHFGTNLNEEWSLGGGLKYIYENLSPIGTGAEKGDGRASTVALDAGMLYKPKALRRLTVGATVANMGPKLTFVDSDQADPLPTNLKVGAAYLVLNGDHNMLTVTTEFNKELVVRHDDGSSDPFYKAVFSSFLDSNSRQLGRINSRVGMEYWYNQVIAVRAGYFKESETFGNRNFFTFGGGIKYAGWGFDFGLIAADPDSSPLANTMRFSLTGLF